MKKSKKLMPFKNIVLIALSVIAAGMFVVGLCTADMDSPVPMTLMITSMAWLVPFGVANGVFRR